MRKILYLTLAVAAALIVTRVALARCLDENCRQQFRPPATAPRLLLWTPAPSASAAPIMSTDMPPIPPATAQPSGYPAAPTDAPTATPEACALDWSLPYSADAILALTHCFHARVRAGQSPAELCPPPGSTWWAVITFITGGNQICVPPATP